MKQTFGVRMAYTGRSHMIDTQHKIDAVFVFFMFWNSFYYSDIVSRRVRQFTSASVGVLQA